MVEVRSLASFIKIAVNILVLKYDAFGYQIFLK